MTTKYDQNQLDTIDVAIGNILDARERGDDEDLCMYTKQLSLFLKKASARQMSRAREAQHASTRALLTATDTKTKWIVLESFGAQKINVIKRLRACVPGLGLRDAKVCVESAPIGISREIPGITDELVTELESAGAFVEVWDHKPAGRCEYTCDYFEGREQARELAVLSRDP